MPCKKLSVMNKNDLSNNTGYYFNILLVIGTAVYAGTKGISGYSIIPAVGILTAIGIQIYRYRIVRFDEDAMYLSTAFGKRVTVIPYEQIQELLRTHRNFWIILDNSRITYQQNGRIKSCYTNISFSDQAALDDFMSIFRKRNPKGAKIA